MSRFGHRLSRIRTVRVVHDRGLHPQRCGYASLA